MKRNKQTLAAGNVRLLVAPIIRQSELSRYPQKSGPTCFSSSELSVYLKYPLST